MGGKQFFASQTTTQKISLEPLRDSTHPQREKAVLCAATCEGEDATNHFMNAFLSSSASGSPTHTTQNSRVNKKTKQTTTKATQKISCRSPSRLASPNLLMGGDTQRSPAPRVHEPEKMGKHQGFGAETRRGPVASGSEQPRREAWSSRISIVSASTMDRRERSSVTAMSAAGECLPAARGIEKNCAGSHRVCLLVCFPWDRHW